MKFSILRYEKHGAGEEGGGREKEITVVIGSRERARSRDRHCDDSRTRHDDNVCKRWPWPWFWRTLHARFFDQGGVVARHNVDPPSNAGWTKTLPSLRGPLICSRYEIRNTKYRIIDSVFYYTSYRLFQYGRHSLMIKLCEYLKESFPRGRMR